MLVAANLLLLLMLLLLAAGAGALAECPGTIPPSERRDCFPWPDATMEACVERGCTWCPDASEVPWCFMNPDICPSEIPEDERVDCLPGGNRSECLRDRCIWCPTETPGVPFCFRDSSVSQGGEFCPDEIADTERIDCHPESGASASDCVQRGCFWCPTPLEGAPFCFVPLESRGYRQDGPAVDTQLGFRLNLERKPAVTWYAEDVQSLSVDVEHHTPGRLRVKIYDRNSDRFEVPLPIARPPSKPSDPMYVTSVTEDPFSFRVIRSGSGTVVFDSSLGPLVFSDQAIFLSTRVPSDRFFGLGETEHHSLRHRMQYDEWGMFARDQPLMQGNLYGVFPFYVCYDDEDLAHGVFFLNSNAQEVELLPVPGVTYRTTGGVLDIYFFMGPTAEDVVRQFTEAVGRPYLPPYWSLGFQLCRYGYDSLENMRAAVGRMRQYDIPHDVQYADIDVFVDEMDFTVDPVRFAGLTEYVGELRAQGTRFISILDPFLQADDPTYMPTIRGNASQVWVRTSSGEYLRGNVWPPDDSFFVDFSLESAQQWWIDECKIFHEILPFDGLWIDMNEPANFVAGSTTGCANNPLNNPIFKPASILGDVLSDGTVCMDARQQFGRHYDVHSLYGWSQVESSLRAARESVGPGKRSLVISRSTFPGVGQLAGHWTGDNEPSFQQLHYSIIGTLEFNMFGIPYVGADICGFMGDAWPQLCKRWHLVGAFQPFARNHNGKGYVDHDPGAWPDVAEATRNVLHIRYRLLPFLYSLFYQAHVGLIGTVIRPLHHDFPQEAEVYDIDRQFLWGSAILFSPVLEEFARTVEAYLPNTRWFDWYTGVEMEVRGGWLSLQAPEDFIPIHVRGGHVIPMQEPANSTVFSRLLPMSLLVALDDSGTAAGTLFWDDGEALDSVSGDHHLLELSVVAQAQQSVLAGVVASSGSAAADLHFHEIRVLGQSSDVTGVTVNGEQHVEFSYDSTSQVLNVTDLQIEVASGFEVMWF